MYRDSISKQSLISVKGYTVPNYRSHNLGNEINVPFSKELGGFLWTLVYESESFLTVDLSQLNADLRHTMYKFLIGLESYRRCVRKLMNPYEICRRCLTEGPSYAKFLKDLRFACISKKFSSTPLEKSDFDNNLALEFYDIADIFHYRFLFPWKEEESHLEYYFLPLRVDEKILSIFVDTMTTMLAGKQFEPVLPQEVILQEGSSSSLLGNKTTALWKAKQIDNSMGSSIGLAKRVVIPIHPQGYRDTVILSPSALNRVKWIDRQTFTILAKIPGSLMLRSTSKIKRLIKKLSKYKLFYSRDLKKDGLTKPRKLLQVTLDVLYKMTGFEAYSKSHFYDNLKLLFDGEVLNPIRGHGLGMANSLTTLINICFFHTSHMIEEDHIFGSSDCLSINDDFVAGFENHEDLESYLSNELTCLDQLGVIVNTKKSYVSSEGFTIAEEYYYRHCDLNSKEHYKLREELLPLAAKNIVLAKALTASSSSRYIDEITSVFGYEFHEDEFHLPHRLGGWLNDKNTRLDSTLKYLGGSNEVVSGLYSAASTPFKKIRNKKLSQGTYYPIVYDLYPDLVIEEEFYSTFECLSIDQISSKYNKSRDIPRLENAEWKNYFRKRRKRYHLSPISTEDLTDIIIKDHPLILFEPLDFMIDHYVEGELFSARIDDVYLGANPKLSYLGSRVGKNIFDVPREEYSILFGNSDSVWDRLPRSNWKDFNGILRIFDVDHDEITTLGSNDNDFLKSWLTPLVVGQYYSLQNFYGNKLPVLKQKYRSPFIPRKETVFGRLLNWKEELALSEFRPLIPILKKSKILEGHPDLDLAIPLIREYITENQRSIDYDDPGGPGHLDDFTRELLHKFISNTITLKEFDEMHASGPTHNPSEEKDESPDMALAEKIAIEFLSTGNMLQGVEGVEDDFIYLLLSLKSAFETSEEQGGARLPPTSGDTPLEREVFIIVETRYRAAMNVGLQDDDNDSDIGGGYFFDTDSD